MDISHFLGGSVLSASDIMHPIVFCQIVEVTQQQVGTDDKVCLKFAQYNKPLALNQTNLRAIAAVMGRNSESWIGRWVELRKEQTTYQGKTVPCIRVYVAQGPPEGPQPQPMFSPGPQPQPAPQPALAAQAPIPGPVQPTAAPAGPVAPPWQGQ